ncbi:hypothetical protein ACQVRX_01555 [Ralstonia pseudosolanacearum]
MKEAPTAAGAIVSGLEEQARAAIRDLKPGGDGRSVGELLAQMNLHRSDTMPLAETLRLHNAIRHALRGLGIHVSAALPEQELDVHVYGVVLDSKALVKACPALKPYGTILDGLTL